MATSNPMTPVATARGMNGDAVTSHGRDAAAQARKAAGTCQERIATDIDASRQTMTRLIFGESIQSNSTQHYRFLAGWIADDI
jgi:hypothetical protein